MHSHTTTAKGRTPEKTAARNRAGFESRGTAEATSETATDTEERLLLRSLGFPAAGTEPVSLPQRQPLQRLPRSPRLPGLRRQPRMAWPRRLPWLRSAYLVEIFRATRSRFLRTLRSDRAASLREDERGAVTAEYALVIVAAVAFAGLLIVIMRSEEVRAMLVSLVQNALGSAG